MGTVSLKILVLLGLVTLVMSWNCGCPNGLTEAEEEEAEDLYSLSPSLLSLDTAFVPWSDAAGQVVLRNLSGQTLALSGFDENCPGEITWTPEATSFGSASSLTINLSFEPLHFFPAASCQFTPIIRMNGEAIPADQEKTLTVQYAAGEAKCELSPEELQFEPVEVGAHADGVLTIKNTTSDPGQDAPIWYIFSSLSGRCDLFSWVYPEDSVGSLGPGQSWGIPFSFEPTAPGDFQCEKRLETGGRPKPCPASVVFRGTGLVSPVQWSVCQPETTADWRGVFTLSPNEVYLVGDGGSVFESSGDCQWAQVGSIPGDVGDVNLTDIWGYSDGAQTAVWAVGNIPPEPGFYQEAGAILRWDGSDWAKIDEDGFHTYATVWGSGFNDVYFAGTGISTDFPNAKHWDGSTLTTLQISDMGMSNVSGLSGTGSEDVWAVLEQNFNSVFQFQGSQWENKTPPFVTQPLNDVWVIPTTLVPTVYVVGDHGAIYRYDGSAWTDESISGESRDFHAVWATASGQLFVVGQDRAIYRGQVGNPTGWTAMTPPDGTLPGDFLDVWGSSEDDVYVVGTDGVVIRLTPGG